MSARIAGGRFAGRALSGPSRSRRAGRAEIRPTAIRLRKSVFEVVGPRLEGERVLDVCAGVGALGFEALSRGAASCAFVERRRAAAALIERNAARLGLAAGQYRVHAGDAARVLPRMRAAGERFGAAFFDPPWPWWRDGAALRLLARIAALEADLLVVEHPASLDPDPIPGYRAARTLRAGDGAGALWRRIPEEPHI